MASRRLTVVLITGLIGGLGSTTANAQTSAPRPPARAWQQPQPKVAAPRPGVGVLGPYRRPPYRDEPEEKEAARRRRDDPRHLHDGLYFRYAAGLGLGADYVDTGNSEYDFRREDKSRAVISGFAAATEVALGGTPLLGMAVGAGVYTVTMPSSDAFVSDPGMKYGFRTSQLALFAPFVDYYILPRQGFHVQGAVGLSVYIMGQGEPTYQLYDDPFPIIRAHTAPGVGFMLGVGHEWWVAEQLGVGALARMVQGFTSGTDQDGVNWVHQTGAYSLLLSVTYH